MNTNAAPIVPRKTKIIATVGPATESPEVLRDLILKGVGIFRLNMSHSKHEWVRKVVADIRAISADTHRQVGLLLDTQGPAIRTGELQSSLQLKPGDTFTFTVRGEKSEELHSVDVNYDGLINDISVGDTVLVDNGVIHMKVLSKDGNQIHCEVLTPGTLGSRKHINLPGVRVNLPAMTEKDKEDVMLAIELNLDFIALSFVREASDIQLLRDFLADHGNNHAFTIIAKVEDQIAIKNIDEIIDAADGVMVARGDLGIECPYEELPIIQRKIVRRCATQFKPVIVATHMLESMITNPVPTRAEVTDVSNAVYEQADAIMLSGETSVGRYPASCVEVMDKIARRVEITGGLDYSQEVSLTKDGDSILSSAVHMANTIRADALLVFTVAGRSAQLTSGLRPKYSPIYAFCPSPELAARMVLLRGVTPIPLPFEKDREITIDAALHRLKLKNLLKPGAKVVVVSQVLASDELFDSLQLRTIH